MRRLLGLLILPVLALPALAENPPESEASASHPARQTWQQHFARANAAHDGHLTSEQAKGGFAAVAKHFDDIDVDHKGYVTENDVRAWRLMRKAAHRLTKPQEDKLPPHAAFQRGRPDAT
jgi:ligand-binding sensor domain-containing protein